MRAAGRLALPGLAFLLGLGSARPAAQADPPVVAFVQDEPTFLAAIELAKGILASGRAGDAQRQVQETLEQHKGKDYVFGKRLELEDLVRRIAFRAECPPPEPQSVVKGALKRFTSKTGAIEIRYEPQKPTDFEEHGPGLLFPPRFRGPYTVTVKGDQYPESTSESPIIQIGWEDDPKTRKIQAWAISFGIAPQVVGTKKIWVPARIFYLNGEDKKTLLEKDAASPEPGKPFRLDVNVTSGLITATVNGTRIGSAPKPEGVYGHTLIKVAKWSEILIVGQIEPSWIQSKLDEIVDAKRPAFEAKFDLHKFLPAWLYEAKPAAGPTPAPAGAPPAGPSATPSNSPPPRGPSPLRKVPQALEADYFEAQAMLSAADFAGALAAALALKAKGASDAVTGLIAAKALAGLGQPTRALPEVDRALACEPGAPDADDARMLKAQILLRLGRDDDLVATLKAATARPDVAQERFETAGLYLLLAGRLADARAMADEAGRRGQHSEHLDALGRVVVRSQNGPDWPKSFQFESNNYRVVSDIDVDTCRQAAQVLEEGLADYRMYVQALKTEAKKLYQVCLFSGKAGFLRYVSDATVLGGKLPEHVAGLYSPILKQLLIWNLPNRDEMMKTVRHEGFHQYLDRLLPDPPVWLNEGMAVYYEGMKHVGGELKTDTPRPELLDDLKGKPLVPLDDFVRIHPAEFYETSPHSYAQAWLLVHMMRHGAQKSRDLYRGLFSRLQTLSGPEAVQAVFDGVSFAALDGDLAAYLNALSSRK